MKQQKELELLKKFPNLFKELEWGFDHNDGWYDIILQLCTDIQAHANTNNLQVDIVQVKEKFGGLRVYCNATDEVIDKLIEEAENKSLVTCEICGNKAQTTSKGGWCKTICVEHARKLGYKEY